IVIGCDLRCVEGRHHGQDTGSVRGGRVIDGCHSSCRDRALNDVTVGDVLDGELGGVFCGAGDLEPSVVAGVELLCVLPVVFLEANHACAPCAARVRARTMLDLASSTLNALYWQGFAPPTASSAALRKVSGVAGAPMRAFSASAECQGLGATPPRARPADLMVC